MSCFFPGRPVYSSCILSDLFPNGYWVAGRGHLNPPSPSPMQEDFPVSLYPTSNSGVPRYGPVQTFCAILNREGKHQRRFNLLQWGEKVP